MEAQNEQKSVSIAFDYTLEKGDIKNTVSLKIDGLPPEEAAHVLDKPFSEKSTIIRRKDGRSAVEAKQRELGVTDLLTNDIVKDEKPGMVGKGLDLKDFDIRKPGDLIQVIKDMFDDADLKVNISNDGTKRNFEIQLTIAGKKFDFKSDDLNDLTNVINATGLDIESDQGAEVVEENGARKIQKPVKFIRKFRATANGDGDDDSIQNENENILTQTKAGFVVTSLLDVNLNAGLNGTLAIMIA